MLSKEGPVISVKIPWSCISDTCQTMLLDNPIPL